MCLHTSLDKSLKNVILFLYVHGYVNKNQVHNRELIPLKLKENDGVLTSFPQGLPLIYWLEIFPEKDQIYR